MPRNGGQQVEHHKALPAAEVAAALAKIDASGAGLATRLAFRLVVLTATRSGEVRGAEWGEIDTTARIWTVPASRSKTNRPFRVPLSPQALAVLADAEALRDGSGSDLIFPNPRTGRALSSEALSKLCREHGLGMTPHGARSSFRGFLRRDRRPPRNRRGRSRARRRSGRAGVRAFGPAGGPPRGHGRMGRLPHDLSRPSIHPLGSRHWYSPR